MTNLLSLFKSFLYDEDKKTLRFSVFCGAIYFVQATGTTGGLAGTAIQFFMKEGLGLSATLLAYIASITSLAWWIKPGFGLLSDFVPLWGYRRKSYIYFCNTISIVLWLALAGMAFGGMLTTFWPLTILSFAMAFCFAMTDVVADGLMVQTGKESNNTGKFQAIQWGTIRGAIMLTTVLGAMLATWAMPDNGKDTFEVTLAILHKLGFIFLIAAIFPSINIAATYFLTEEKKIRLTKEKFNEIKAGIKKALKMKQIWILAICMFGLNFSPGWGTPFFYYMRDFCGPEGGQMGKMTFAWLSTFESAMGILGCIAYFKWCKKVHIKKFLYFGILLGFVTSFFYLWVQGVYSLFVFAFLFGPISAFISLAYLDVAAKNCPNLAEGFVFAGLCSILNIASASSNAVGGWLYGALEKGGSLYDLGWSLTGWLTSFGVSPNMVGLRPLIIISALFTLATIVLIRFMKLDSQGNMEDFNKKTDKK